MKNWLVNFALFFFIIATSEGYGAYSVVVDVNSTTSAHLFQHNDDKKLPEIKLLYSTSYPLSLAAFNIHPEDAGPALKPLLDDLTKKLEEEKITEAVSIRILGTAKMRFLSQEEQLAIYTAIKNYLLENYRAHFTPGELKTISGKMEGIYHWLDINYIAENFQKKTPPFGSVDIDENASHITFAIDKQIKPIDELNIKINDVNYTVFSKSFLGLGLTNARERINQNPNAPSCYPKNANFTGKNGKFNLISCRFLYRELLESFEIEKQILPTYKVTTFIATEGIYETYRFFSVDLASKDQETLEQKTINPLCGNNWEILKAAYPNEEESKLLHYCANGIYLTELLYNAYQLQNKQLKVAYKINQDNINWTRGVIFYELIAT